MTENIAMSAALQRAGFEPRDVALDAALARYRNNGGTEEGAMTRVRAAFAMPGEGHKTRADKAVSVPPSARHPIADGAGQNTAADKAGGTAPVPSAPRRMERQPTATDRAAAATVRKAGAVAVLKHLGWMADAHVPGGPRYIDLRVRDIDGMIKRQLSEGMTHARSAVVLTMIQRAVEKAGTPDPEQKWTDVLPKAEVARIAAATEAERLKSDALDFVGKLTTNAVNTIAGDTVDA